MSYSGFIETHQTPAQVGLWRIVWKYTEDRWQHSVQLCKGNQVRDFLVSGNTEPQVGPVFQDLLVEERPDGVIEFQAMGQSGKAIHSGSICCHPDSLRITFELAARFREASEAHPLVSAYIPLRMRNGSIPTLTLNSPVTPGKTTLLAPVDSDVNSTVQWTPPVSSDPGKRPGTGLTVSWGYEIHLPAVNLSELDFQ